MKSTKERVYEYVCQTIYIDDSHTKGVETREIAAALGKQRSNISTALNELLKEGRLIKTDTRPVLYNLPEQNEEHVLKMPNKSGCNRLIGEDGSLHNAVKLAKAAILYPKRPLTVLLNSKGGCGTTYFVTFIHRYAVENGVLQPGSSYVKINCRHYIKKLSLLDEELFGANTKEGNCFERAKGGLLFIDYFDLLDVHQQTRIFTFLETGYIDVGDRKIDCSDVYLVLSCSELNEASLKRRIPVSIELPELSERPLEERFLLLNYFFETEAKELKRDVEVSIDVIKALLVAEFSYNVKEMQYAVLMACANAYARVASEKSEKIRVCIEDFGANIKRSLLEVKNHQTKLNTLLGDREILVYDQVYGYQELEESSVKVHNEVVQDENIRPVVLYAMHGNGAASSLSEVTNALTDCANAYSYDLTLEIDAKRAMEELKELSQKINRGAGIIVIYDVEYIKAMLETIAEELHIEMRFLNVPVTLIGTDAAYKCMKESDIDYVYHLVSQGIWKRRFDSVSRNNVIITLCHTGDGGAMYLKKYIDQHSRLGIKTIAFGISDRKILLKEAMELKRAYNIHAFVGTYDPKLMGVPFISAAKLLDASVDNVDRILMFEPVKLQAFDYSKVYASLEEQLKYTSVAKLKTVLPQVVDELTTAYSLDDEQAHGIFIHLACVVERALSGGKLTKNPDAKKIIHALEEDYRVVSHILKKIEKVFKIIIDDNEIATLIMVLKKL